MTRYVSERLTSRHHPDAFRCGVDALDGWLLEHVANAQSMRAAQTFVWHRGDDGVVGYFSLAAHLVVRGELPKRLGRESPGSIPAVTLVRLALDVGLHGEGLGGELLWDALTRARAASDIAAARLVVVDAISREAAAFYEHHGFTPIPENPNRLVQNMSDIAHALDAGTV